MFSSDIVALRTLWVVSGGLALDLFSSLYTLLSIVFQLRLFNEAAQKNRPVWSGAVALMQTAVLGGEPKCWR